VFAGHEALTDERKGPLGIHCNVSGTRKRRDSPNTVGIPNVSGPACDGRQRRITGGLKWCYAMDDTCLPVSLPE